MLIILQIMSRMLVKGYYFHQIESEFKALEVHDGSVSSLVDELGLEELSAFQEERFYRSLRHWPSALAVTKIKLGA